MTSVAGVVDGAVSALRHAGFSREEARRDALVLARGVLQWSLADWLARCVTEAPETFQATFAELVARRCEREPVAYLLGEREFYGRPFRVTPDTLIPRPETEDLVEAALAWLRRRRRKTRIIDVGTGTGCVAITIALEHAEPPALEIFATDTSDAALAVARENARALGAATVEFRSGNLLANPDEPIDLIVSNPPYVPARDRDTLQPDVVRFEPALALFGGEDGLDVIRRLIPAARQDLAPGGALMMEIGVDQAGEVTALLEAAGFASIDRRQDLQGIDRILVAQAPDSSL